MGRLLRQSDTLQNNISVETPHVFSNYFFAVFGSESMNKLTISLSLSIYIYIYIYNV